MSTKKFRLLVLLCLHGAVFAFPACVSANDWILYDDFQSKFINPDKWYGSEFGSAGRESERLVVSGKLSMFELSYGLQAISSSKGASKRLSLHSAGGIKAIKAAIKPVTYNFFPCPNSGSRPWVEARLYMRVMKVVPEGPNSKENDLFAHVGVYRSSESTDPEGTLRVRGVTGVCMDDACYNTNILWQSDLGSVTQGKTVTVSIDWDKDNQKFVFQRGSKKVVYSYTIPTEYPPTVDDRRLEVWCQAASCPFSLPPWSFMKAVFDNVYVKTFAP